MGKLTGNIKFLKQAQIKRLESLFKRKIPRHQFFTLNCLNVICKISREIYKQIGLVADRNGTVQYIIIGDEKEIFWPTFYEFRLNRFNLRGIRAFHTHLHSKGLDNDDLTDLSYLRFDFMGVVIANENGSPGNIEIAKISQKKSTHSISKIYSGSINNFNLNYSEELTILENSLKRVGEIRKTDKERVILVAASNKPKYILEEEIDELTELAKAANYHVADSITQRINKVNPSLVLGKGKFKELIIESMFKKADKIIFYDNLTPAQAKYIANFTEIEVIDRTVLILNIFARRALSKDGKLKVELAKLKYLLPRISGRAEALSRIRGGIGLRGPGETAAEVEKRRIKSRIKKIESELKKFSNRRHLLRKKRERKNIPVVSIVGYTNAGKSTLINRLTEGKLFVENLLFATLDTYSRQLSLPNKINIIVTDTVGFIKNLPDELFDAFKSTIEELKYSDLLIHLVDISDENYPEHIKTVEKILYDLEADEIDRVIVFNKVDEIDSDICNDIAERYGALTLSAKEGTGIDALLGYLTYFFVEKGVNVERSGVFG